MQLFAFDVEGGDLYSMWKVSTDPDSPWTTWSSMGPMPGFILNIGYLTDGRMQLFAIGNDHSLYSAWKVTTNPNSSWSEWNDMGRPQNADDLNLVSVGYLLDGRMQLFAADAGGAVQSRYKTSTNPNASWSDWARIGGGGAPLVEYLSAVGYVPDGRIQLFATAIYPDPYPLWSIWSTSTVTPSSWSDWFNMSPLEGLPYGVQVGYLPA
jgi:hypothetical protein